MDQNTKRDFVCKTPRCLVWETELPFLNTPRESRTFTYLDRTCYLKLYIKSGYFSLVLNCGSELVEVKGATIHMKSLKSEISVVQTSKRQYLWSCREKDFLADNMYFPLEKDWRFCIMFNQDIVDPNDLTRDQSTQTPSEMEDCPCLESLSADLSKLLDTELSSSHDVELKCGNHTLRAHRNILSARSRVIAKMLGSDMLEGRTEVVEIQGMNCNILKLFLRYLYTGKFPELDTTTACGLYEAGDKYEVLELAGRCSDFLKENLTLTNTCEILKLADEHSDQLFKESVMTYILDNRIPLQDEYFSPFSAHLKLAYEVLIRFCKLLANERSDQDSKKVPDDD